MRIRWTVPAADDLQSINNYLQQHYPHFAQPTMRTIYQRIPSLKTSLTGAKLVAVAAQENWRSRRSLTSWSIQSKLKPSKSCISITVRKTGADAFSLHKGDAPVKIASLFPEAANAPAVFLRMLPGHLGLLAQRRP